MRHLSLAAWLLCVAPALAQQTAKTLADNDPEIERRSFVVDPAFEVSLYAADPLLAKPIQMNFDPAGRLWIASSETYPQIKPGETADDKILILEDTTGVGRADKVTVFARGLLIPTGVEPGDGGAYVADSTDLVHLSDTNGDGKADRRRVVLSGFGTEDTHHLLHTLRWGHDGLLYMNQAVYIHSHVETPHGVRRLNGGGSWWFRPESGRLEVFMRGMWNSWGHHFDHAGRSFMTDGAGSEGINYVFPGAAYPASVGVGRILHGLNPGSPKYCGLEFATGSHLPPQWQGNLLTNDFRGHRVCRFEVTPEGAGFTARELGELIKTTHPAFRPVDVKMGPDGAIYIADWYNPIIQHGEVDFRDPRRDRTHGRIWRVTAKGRPLVARPQLLDASVDDLLKALTAPEGYTRQRARRLLKERGAKAVLPALETWASHADDEATRLEALWVYQSLDLPEPALLRRCLEAKSADVRGAAVRVLSHWLERVPEPLSLLAPRAADENMLVRLEAVRALGQLPTRPAVDLVLGVLDRPTDKWIDYALWLTLREQEPVWRPALADGSLDLAGHPRRAEALIEAGGGAAALTPLLAAWTAGRIAAEREGDILALMSRHGGPTELRAVFERALAENDAARRTAALTALEQAARLRKQRPAGDLSPIAAQIAGDDAAARLAGFWGLTALASELERLAANGRAGAFTGLVALNQADALKRLAAADRPESVRRRAVPALAQLDPNTAAPLAVELLATVPPGELLPAFLDRKDGPAALVKALSGQTVPADAAKLAVRTITSAGRDLKPLVEAFTTAGQLTAAKPALTPEQIKAMAVEALAKGDPARGEAVFRRASLQCLKCHAIAGAGGRVGPGLESIGGSAPVDYLVESLLLPSKQIKEGYHTLVVSTSGGKVISGVKVRQSDTALVLRDAEDREISVPLNEIEEQAQGKSLMPEGLLDPLTHQELLDLSRFLAELGKVGPYAVSRAALLRRWQVLQTDKPAYTVLNRKGLSWLATSEGLSWQPAYSTVAGVLPLDGLPRLLLREAKPLVVVQGQVEVTTAGPVGLAITPTKGVTLYVDGEPTPMAELVTRPLTKGVHTLTLMVSDPAAGATLRCEVVEVSGSSAKAVPVVGK